MVNEVKQLYELQEVDLEIEAKRQMLAHIKGRLGESEALIQARARLAGERERLSELEGRLKREEWEAENVRARAETMEGRLYDGSARNPKELEKIQQEMEHLKARQGEREDIILDIMIQIDSVQKNISQRNAELEHIEREWRGEQKGLLEEREGLFGALSSLENRRGLLASHVDPGSLELYELLRERKQGRAIARVEQGMCQGCHITLPVSEFHRARGGEGLVQCSSCGRILYTG